LVEDELSYVGQEVEDESATATKVKKQRKSVFDKWSEKLKEFLDNAE